MPESLKMRNMKIKQSGNERQGFLGERWPCVPVVRMVIADAPSGRLPACLAVDGLTPCLGQLPRKFRYLAGFGILGFHQGMKRKCYKMLHCSLTIGAESLLLPVGHLDENLGKQTAPLQSHRPLL